MFTVKSFERIKKFGGVGLDIREPIFGENLYHIAHSAGELKKMARCKVTRVYERNYSGWTH